MRLEKLSISDEIRSWMNESTFVLFTDYRGLVVRQTDDLRRRLKDVSAQLRIVPNRQCRRILGELQWRLPGEDVLSGPTAVIFGSGDVVETAKCVSAFTSLHRAPVIKWGRLDGRCYPSAEMNALADIPARPVLYAMLVGALAAPTTSLAGVFNQTLLRVVYVLKAAHEKRSQTI